MTCYITFQDCLFACEYHGGYIALRDQEGLYLSPIGSRAVLKTRYRLLRLILGREGGVGLGPTQDYSVIILV